MKRKNYWIIAIVGLLFFVACGKKEALDPKADFALINAMESARNQSVKGIDLESLKTCAALYEKSREMGKVCLCNALIGCKLFFDGDYDKSLIHLKRAEANLQYCDSMSSFVYSYIVSNTKTTDTILALNYAKKALEKDLEYNNLRRLPYSYMDLSLLTKGDSARYYLEKSLEYFDDFGDMVAKSKYAWWHIDELHPDTIIAYAKPCYDSVCYAGNACVLVEAYLRKEKPDSALMYIETVGKHKFFKTDYSFYNSRRLSQLGKHEEANMSWEETYYLQREEFLFMFSQRLSAINGEYDLLNKELENKKERLRIRGIYNVVLLVMMTVLVVAFVAIERYRKNVYSLKQNVDSLEQNVVVLEQEVSGLESEVSGLTQEVNDLELEVKKRKERFSALFDEYKKGYNASRKTMMADALVNLDELHKAYPELKKTDLTIIWLTFMDCSRDSICDFLNITKKYYYQRKSIIQRVLGLSVEEGDTWHKLLDKLVRKYIHLFRE